MEKLNITRHFNNKAFQKNKSDRKLDLTPIGSGFPFPGYNYFSETGYNLCCHDEQDNFECENNLIQIESNQIFKSIGIIALGLYGDYFGDILVGQKNKEYSFEIFFPCMDRTSLSIEGTKIFYTSEYVISQNALKGIVKQDISLFEIRLQLESETPLEFVKFPENSCIHIFAITLF